MTILGFLAVSMAIKIALKHYDDTVRGGVLDSVQPFDRFKLYLQ